MTVRPARPGSYKCEPTFLDEVRRAYLRWDGKGWDMAHDVVPIWWCGKPTEFRWRGVAEES